MIPFLCIRLPHGRGSGREREDFWTPPAAGNPPPKNTIESVKDPALNAIRSFSEDRMGRHTTEMAEWAGQNGGTRTPVRARSVRGSSSGVANLVFFAENCRFRSLPNRRFAGHCAQHTNSRKISSTLISSAFPPTRNSSPRAKADSSEVRGRRMMEFRRKRTDWAASQARMRSRGELGDSAIWLWYYTSDICAHSYRTAPGIKSQE